MTFTFNPSATPSNVTRVRYHIGDTVSDTAIYSDEVIEMLIAEAGSWQKAVISAINGIIAQIARDPKFEADWLKVDRSDALKFYGLLLSQKRAELFSSGGVQMGTVDPTREYTSI